MSPLRVLTVALVFVVAQSAKAADSAVGTWRTSFPIETQRGQLSLNLLFLFGEADGKGVADFLDSTPPLPGEPSMDLTVKEESVQFKLKFGPNAWSFDGRLQPGGKRIKGSLDVGREIILIDLVKSNLKSVSKDPFAANREALDNAETPNEFFGALFPILGQVGAKKVKPEEVRAYADRAAKMAEPYGLRWQRTVAFRMADALADQEAFAGIAVEQARLAERMLSRTDDVSTQLQALDTLARVLKKAKKDADAKEADARVARLEVRDYADYAKTMPPFKPEEFAGRKAKSDRAVLVELFTGSECAPCVAVDLAFDSLGRTYKATEVILLQYHQHIPGPDPLVSKDGASRFDFYAKKDDDKGTPMLVIAGTADKSGGGSQAKQAKLKYQGYREQIEPLLEKPASVKLSASVTLKGSELTIKGVVNELAKPGDKVSLRFALAEERVRFTGGNGIRYHHAVVRAMPGGVKGFPLPKASAEQTVTVNLDEVRAANNKELDTLVAALKKQDADFSFTSRPQALRNLKLVAFVQNDETNEVLQAVQVDVEGAKE